jgi:hypothetical protein
MIRFILSDCTMSCGRVVPAGFRFSWNIIMSDSTVGAVLAEAVATRLQAGERLAYHHPEYCGMGLHYSGGAFIYCEVNDGDMPDQQQYQQWKASGNAGEFLAFADRAGFVAWLAAQSDASLSGRDLSQAWLHDNQRLTLKRLQEFAG